jgi:hypothetical protein
MHLFLQKRSNPLPYLNQNQIPYIKNLEINSLLLFVYFKTTTTNLFSSGIQFEDHSSNISQTIKKFLVLTQLYAFLLLSCGARSLEKKPKQPTLNIKKDLISKNHFGYIDKTKIKLSLPIWFSRDLRAHLEIAIEKVLHTVRSFPKTNNQINPSSDTEVRILKISLFVYSEWDFI